MPCNLQKPFQNFPLSIKTKGSFETESEGYYQIKPSSQRDITHLLLVHASMLIQGEIYEFLIVLKSTDKHSGSKEHYYYCLQLLYLDNTATRNLVILNMPNCGQPCHLDTFLRLTRPVVPQDWDRECKTVTE